MAYIGYICPNCGAILNCEVNDRVRVNCPDASNTLSFMRVHILLDAEKQPEYTAKYEAPIRNPLPKPKIYGE